MIEEDIARVLRAAGPRERAPEAVESAVREELRREWRAIVAERRGSRRRAAGLALAASLLVAAAGLWLAATRPVGPTGPVATMAVAIDDVRVRGRWWQAWQAAPAGRALKAGDSIET